MSKTFMTIDKKESLSVSNRTILNAQVLSDTAKNASMNNNFGVATSLMILSTEEIIKAQVLFFLGIGIHIHKIKNANKIFSSHKEKHQFASLLQFTKIIEGFIDAGNYESDKKIYQTGSKIMNNILEGLQGFKNLLQPITLISRSIEQMKENIEWLEKANDLKNLGFYVDYKDEIKLPQSISSEAYNKALLVNKECFNLYRIIKLTYEKITDSESKIILIKSINNELLPQIEWYLKPKVEC